MRDERPTDLSECIRGGLGALCGQLQCGEPPQSADEGLRRLLPFRLVVLEHSEAHAQVGGRPEREEALRAARGAAQDCDVKRRQATDGARAAAAGAGVGASVRVRAGA